MCTLFLLVMIMTSSLAFAFDGGKKNKNVKVAGKTVYISYPKDWWPNTESTIQLRSLDATLTIPNAILNTNIPTKTSYSKIPNELKVTSTYFVDLRLSKEYLRLWRRTHRGLHWLPPKPTEKPQ